MEVILEYLQETHVYMLYGESILTLFNKGWDSNPDSYYCKATMSFILYLLFIHMGKCLIAFKISLPRETWQEQGAGVF